MVTVTNYSYAIPPCTGSCNGQNEDLLLTQLYNVGPVSICVDAEPWQYYTGGVMKSGCPHAYSNTTTASSSLDTTSRPRQDIGLFVTAGTPTEYEGFIYLQMGSNLCGVGDEA